MFLSLLANIITVLWRHHMYNKLLLLPSRTESVYVTQFMRHGTATSLEWTECPVQRALVFRVSSHFNSSVIGKFPSLLWD